MTKWKDTFSPSQSGYPRRFHPSISLFLFSNDKRKNFKKKYLNILSKHTTLDYFDYLNINNNKTTIETNKKKQTKNEIHSIIIVCWSVCLFVYLFDKEKTIQFQQQQNNNIVKNILWMSVVFFTFTLYIYIYIHFSGS